MMKKMMMMTMLVLTLLVSACGLTPTQMAAPAPTQDVGPTLNAVRTEAVQTAEADMANQAAPTEPAPAATLAPTATELPSPTAVPTLPPADTLAPTLVPTSTRAVVSGATAVPANYDCSVSNVSPQYLAEFAPRGEMDGKWTVKNSGSKTWGAPDVDVIYVAGEEMQQYTDTYNLSKDVAPGESVDIVVDLLAPALPGIYKTTWGLAMGGTPFCTFNLTIQVK
jgi:hypothetical protein